MIFSKSLNISKFSKIEDVFASYDITPSNIASIYDISKDSIIPITICTRKVEKINLEEQAAKTTLLEEKDIKKEFDINDILKNYKDFLLTIKQRKLKNTPIKILLIEDDVFSRKMLKKILQKDYDVIEADDGRDGVIKYIMNAPDMLFLDINLPDVTGIDLIHKIKDIDSDAHIIMLSANSYKENILSSMQKGAKGFIAKPYSKEKVLHYIAKYKEKLQ